jgi:vacuolar protein sorting-associated protein IST1
MQAGKLQSARIRVENIIRSDITTELHEMLELYCELVLARSQLLDPPSLPHSSPASSTAIPLDPALEEAVRSLIYAAPRTDIKELHQTRNLLVEKFGKDVALASMEGEGVAERVLNKLRVSTPKPELVDAYLSEIARFYGVPFGEAKSAEDDDDEDEPGGGVAEPAESQKELESALKADPGSDKKAKEDEEREELVKATPPKQFGPQSPLRITAPSPSTDNVAPKLRLPGSTGAAARKPEAKKKDAGPGGKIPDVDELARRFADLKR